MISLTNAALRALQKLTVFIRGLHQLCFPSPCVWSKTYTTIYQPIKCKTKTKHDFIILFPVHSRIRSSRINLFIPRVSSASSDISFFLMDPCNYFGLGFTRLNRKTRSLSCLLSAICYCVALSYFDFLFCCFCCCCSKILNEKGYTISLNGVDNFQMISLNCYFSLLLLLQ